MRLDRLLSNRGYGSRKEVAALLREGRVVVNGVPQQDREHDVSDGAEILVDGVELDPGPGLVLMLNKPAGYTCSRDDQGALVYELLPERFFKRKPALMSVGRLDRETTGLLLFTDDGALLHRLTSPRHKVQKIYRVAAALPLSDADLSILSSGTIVLDGEDEPVLPAKVQRLGESGILLSICEGRYHQVRRMLAAIGNSVTALHRESIGCLTLGDLRPGDFRILTPAEAAAAQSAESAFPEQSS